MAEWTKHDAQQVGKISMNQDSMIKMCGER